MTRWRGVLDRLEGGDGPSLAIGATSTGAGELAAGSAAWARAFHGAGLVPGDRLLLAVEDGPALAQVLVAAMAFGLTVVPVPPGADPVPLAAEVDPRAGVAGPAGLGGRDVPWAFAVDGAAGPAARPLELRPAGPPTPEARMLVRPGHGVGWVALSDGNLGHVVDGLLHALRPDRARWLSALAWDEPAGLLLDLLPALAAASSVVRPADVDDAAALAGLAERWQPTHVAITVRQAGALAARWGGLEPLRGVLDGLAVGPGLDDPLAAALKRTKLRTARGVPELSCLVALGEPGRFRPGAVGRPLGCDTEPGPGGATLVRGPQAAFAAFEEGGLVPLDPERDVPVLFV